MFSCIHVTISYNSRWFYPSQRLHFLNFRILNIRQRLRHILENPTHKPNQMELRKPDSNPTWPVRLFNVMVSSLIKVRIYIISGRSHYLMYWQNRAMMCGLGITEGLSSQIGIAISRGIGISISIILPNMINLRWLTKSSRKLESQSWFTLDTPKAQPPFSLGRVRTHSYRTKSRNSSVWALWSASKTFKTTAYSRPSQNTT